MKISEILNLTDLSVLMMKEDELRKVVQHVGKYTKRRYNTLKSKNFQTPAFVGFEKSGGLIDPNVKTLNQLRSEFKRGRMFLAAKTSTITGAKEVAQKAYKRIGLSKKFPLNTFWRIWEKLIEIRPDYGQKGTSDRIQTELAVFMNAYTKSSGNSNSFDRQITYALKRIQTINEKTVKTDDDILEMQDLELLIVERFTNYIDNEEQHPRVEKEFSKIEQRGTDILDELTNIRRRK